MQSPPKFRIAPLSAAISTALMAGPTLVSAQGAEAVRLEQIIVTARKREESAMDIPSSIQALSEQEIREMGARGIGDYTRFMPSVNVINYSAGDSVVIFRGANTDEGGEIVQSTSSVYLNEISISNTFTQPSVRMVDVERVEALSGPQGTLYGSDAQAGTLRIITNKPVMDEFSVVTDLSGRDNSEGEISYDHSVVANFPLIEQTLAVRLVGFTAKDGGFIDNVFGHTPDSDTSGKVLPSGFGTLDNAHVLEDDWNDAKTDGWRASALWDINETWSAVATAMSQDVDAGAYNSYDPFVGDLEVVSFYDDFRTDEYDMYSLQVEGDLGFAQLVSATSFFEREEFISNDNTVYNHHWSGSYCHTYVGDPSYFPYYFANPDGSGVVFWPAYCKAPTVEGDYLSAFDYSREQDRFTQEFRLSSQGDTIDWLLGFFYEDAQNDWHYNFAYPTRTESNPGGPGVNLYQESISLAYFEQFLGQTFPNATTYWDETSLSDWQQTALFGEVVWHVNDQLDLTFGARYFDRENEILHWQEQPTGNLEELAAGLPNISGSEEEIVPKISASYRLTEDSMLYGVWTEGYRPPGVNRSRGEPLLPTTYDSDKITNTEIGYKTTLGDGRGRFSFTLFQMDWEDYQLEIVDPSNDPCPEGGPSPIPNVCGQPWQNVVANGGDASIDGYSLEFDWAFTSNFYVGLNAEWLDAETQSTLDLSGDGIANILRGQRLPMSPEATGSAWASYNWPMPMFSGNGFARLQWSYNGDTLSNLEPNVLSDDEANPQYKNSAFDIGDLSVGVRTDDWEASLFVNNITDERAQLQHDWGIFLHTAASTQDGRAHHASITTNRPREMGVRFIYNFGGG